MPNAERFPAGAVTRLGPPPSDLPPPPPPSESRGPRRLWWFAGAAALIVLTGLVVVIAARPGGSRRPEAPTDARPPLARACPPPPDLPGTAAPATPPPAPAGTRTVDETAGISYPAYGPPWETWNTIWNAGDLRVPYRVGQHFVTEAAYDGRSDYHASVLSGAVPAATNDAFTFDLECVGRQVAADARSNYYPQPNQQELIRDERTVLGGRPAWVTVFRLRFSTPGLRAKSELVALACIDVGKPTAAVLYVSVPETHHQWDWVADDALAGMRPV
ncbi:hypothetical protein SAMN05421812_103502 [Asanoa hainanensis]|uniref:Uncharacterized protein n=1 Tax=Asanoa hainanensis TaxID=560556 RepID=A0A239KI62_9ACTN|nr:hypothetical protein [Asanoa hainanensis]SNT16844.1 hypothetical protein SAMN05421812_103502 [Asanoa hainanensis]